MPSRTSVGGVVKVGTRVGRCKESGFSLAGAPGILAYLDSNNGVFQSGSTPSGIGDPVGKWTNRAGSAFTFEQTTTSKKPTRQPDGVDHDGVDDGLASVIPAGGISGSFSFYFRARLDDAASASQYLFDTSGTRLLLAQCGDTPGQVSFFDNATTTWRSIAAATTGLQTLTFIFDDGAGTGYVYRDGTLLGSAAWGGVTLGSGAAISLFYKALDTVYFTNGALRALAMYNAVHSDAQQTQIEQYLSRLP